MQLWKDPVKKGQSKKVINEHHINVIVEDIRVFILGLACKKKCIVRSRRGRISMLGALQSQISKLAPYLGL